MSLHEVPGHFTVLIPARLASTRLPDKPLADIGGLPMVVRVARQAQRSAAQRCVVAADDVRIVLEPRVRTVEPDMLMGMLFKNSDLEIRFSLNMNVLIDGRVPRVCSLKEVLRAFLDHRREVLRRRSLHRIEKIDTRLEVLDESEGHRGNTGPHGSVRSGR